MVTGGPILLVEDSEDDQLLIQRSLKKGGMLNEVVIANDGVEALDYLLGTGARAEAGPLWPVVVLLDINMPRVSGLQVLERIRGEEATRRLPVIMLTSSNEESDVLRSYDLGVNSYVRKPVEFSEFTEAVSRLGLYWLMLNEAPPGG